MAARARALALVALLLAAATASAPAAGAGEYGVMRPRDEGAQDASFAAFRQRLLEIITRFDKDALFAVTAEDVNTGWLIDEYGGDFGLETLRVAWFPDAEPVESHAFWRVLRDILEHGGRFVAQGRFCAPYFHTEFPALLAADRRYRYDVALAAPTIVYHLATVRSYELGRAEQGEIIQALNPPDMTFADVEEASDIQFEAVWYADQPGYVDASQARRLGGVFACFSRQADGAWLMDHFGAPRQR